MKKILSVMMAVLTSTAISQIIPLKTVPLATGNQFLFHPSENTIMGGVSIAHDDSLSDPYHNPAAGVLVSGVRIFASPLYYGISPRDNRSAGSSGATFPLGMSFRTENFFGGMIWARQTISPGDSPGLMGFPRLFPGKSFQLMEEHLNTYTFGMFGFTLPGTALSIGVSAQWSDLNAMEGVQHLYPNATGLSQKGSIRAYRLGLRSAWDGDRVFEFLFAHENTDMKHELGRSYTIWPFDSSVLPPPYGRVEEDQSSGYALEAVYRQRVTSTVHAGVLIAADVKTYPKIPNYELMNIPRDPGDSRAWNFGFGVVNNNGRGILGVDFIYEPAFSETWAEAMSSVPTAGGRTIAAGGRTIENTFDFYNHIIRFGIRSAVYDLGMGLSLHRVKYYLKQIDFVEEVERRQKEEWTEVTFSLGFGFNLFGGHMKYLGLFTTGTGRPGVDGTVMDSPRLMYDSANFMVAPSGRLSLDEALTGTHQLSFVLHLP